MSNPAEILTLSIAVKGEVVSCNLPEFRDAVTLFLSEINRDLVTDDQFGQAEIDVKRLKSIEESIVAAKKKALEDAETLRNLFDSLDDATGEVSKARLELEKLIKQKKESVKSALVATALNNINCAPHLRLKTYGTRMDSAIKGKRTLDSMEAALNQAVGMANEQIAKCREVIAVWQKANDEDSPPDYDALIITSPDMVRLELQRRSEKKAADAECRRLEDVAEQERQKARAAQASAVASAAPSEVDRRNEWERQEKEDKAAMQAAPAPQPIAPAVVATPAPEGETEEQELARYKAACLACFAPLKAARAALQHPANIEKAGKLAAAINAAWTELKGGAK